MHCSPQELKGDAEVVAEIKILLHVDDVVAVVSVSPSQCVQDLQLHQSLLVESGNHEISKRFSSNNSDSLHYFWVIFHSDNCSDLRQYLVKSSLHEIWVDF